MRTDKKLRMYVYSKTCGSYRNCQMPYVKWVSAVTAQVTLEITLEKPSTHIVNTCERNL